MQDTFSERSQMTEKLSWEKSVFLSGGESSVENAQEHWKRAIDFGSDETQTWLGHETCETGKIRARQTQMRAMHIASLGDRLNSE